MIYSDEFYYEEEESSYVYTDKPSGNLSVSRFLQGQKKYWGSLSSQERKPKRKRLILADWTARSWSQNKIMDVKGSLSELMSDGFSIDLWSEDHLVPLTEDTLDLLDSSGQRYNILPEQKDKMMEVALHDKHLSSNTVHVLDDYWVDYLVSSNDLKNRVICISYFLKYPKEKQNDLIEILENSIPPLGLIINDVYSLRGNVALMSVSAAFPNAIVLNQYDKATFEHFDGQLYLDNPAAFLGDDLNLNRLDELTLDCSKLTSDQIEMFLTQSLRITQLNLLGCTPGSIIFNTMNLPFLKKLSVTGDLNTTDLKNVLQAAPSLEELSLSPALLDDVIPSNCVRNLKRIECNGISSNVVDGELKVSKLANLIENIPGLQSLALYNLRAKSYFAHFVTKDDLMSKIIRPHSLL